MFLPGEFHGERSVEGYSPWGHKESDTTERLIWSDLKRSTQAYTTIKLLKDKGQKKKCILKLAKVKVKVKSPSVVQLFVTPWTIAYQAPQFMEFSRQEYWSGLSFPSPRQLSDPGIEPRSLPCRQTLYRLNHQGSPSKVKVNYKQGIFNKILANFSSVTLEIIRE